MKKHLLLWTGTLLLILFALAQSAQAQGNTKECNESQPRPIIGDQHPCPGDTIQYCITEAKANEREYTSYDWDVPRAQAGEPPIGWVIPSGQNTRCVTVVVGQKSGTMKVKVNDPLCGTKVATLPVKPGKEFDVSISGPDSICVRDPQTYTASLRKINPNGNLGGPAQGNFNYMWFVPEGWVIKSGQGTAELVVIPGNTDGDVSLYVTNIDGMQGKGNQGNGVGGIKGYCGTSSDAIPVVTNENCGAPCPAPVVLLNGPSTVCNLSDTTFTYSVANPQAGVTYAFNVPEGFIILEEQSTPTSVTVQAAFGEEQLNQRHTISVTATSECGTATANKDVMVLDCGLGTPLPVTLTRFDGSFSSGGVTLNWETATEINNERFEVERSANGIDFLKIGEVKGNGNSSVTLKYSFTDKQPLAGTLYYRLKQVDYDGAYEYSKVIAVESKAVSTGTFKVSLFPNPGQGSQVSARFEGLPQNAGEVTLRVVDMSGRVLHTATLPAGSLEVNLGLGSLGLRQGMYLVSLSAGGQNAVQRLVIQ